MRLPKTKAEARALGVPRFFTGKPCNRNHVAERRTACGTCIQCARIAEEKYRDNNGDKCRKSQKRWRENNREIAGERVKHCRIANPEPSRRAAKKFYDANPDNCRQSSNDWRKKIRRGFSRQPRNGGKIIERGAVRWQCFGTLPSVKPRRVG